MFLLCINWDAVTAIATSITCFVAFGSAITAGYQYWKESHRLKEATRSRILADYNWHFIQNNSIQKVTKALLDDNFNSVHIYDLEVFMHFFEELYLLIHSEGRMKPEIAKYMFSYYALQAWNSNQFWLKYTNNNESKIVEEMNSEDWILFRKFVEEMRDLSVKNISI